jgi:hypothetical protein
LPLVATGALAWAASERVHAGLAVALVAVVLVVVVPALLAAGVALLTVAVLAGERLGGPVETPLTVLGSFMLVSGHLLNLRLPHAHADLIRSRY